MSPFEAVALVAPDRRLTHTPSPDERYIAVAAGTNHTCALAVHGTAYCWGFGLDGQTDAPPDERFVSIAGHANTTCGLRPDGRAVCWGENVRSPWSPRPDSSYKSVTRGVGVLVDGTVQWWSAAPGGYTPTGRFRSVTAGETFWCGLRDDGSVECWDVEGTLPSGPEDLAFTSISSDYEFACALDDAGTPHCWHVRGFPQGLRPTSAACGRDIYDDHDGTLSRLRPAR